MRCRNYEHAKALGLANFDIPKCLKFQRHRVSNVLILLNLSSSLHFTVDLLFLEFTCWNFDSTFPNRMHVGNQALLQQFSAGRRTPKKLAWGMAARENAADSPLHILVVIPRSAGLVNAFRAAMRSAGGPKCWDAGLSWVACWNPAMSKWRPAVLVTRVSLISIIVVIQSIDTVYSG